jgi:hypothetical protein
LDDAPVAGKNTAAPALRPTRLPGRAIPNLGCVCDIRPAAAHQMRSGPTAFGIWSVRWVLRRAVSSQAALVSVRRIVGRRFAANKNSGPKKPAVPSEEEDKKLARAMLGRSTARQSIANNWSPGRRSTRSNAATQPVQRSIHTPESVIHRI